MDGLELLGGLEPGSVDLVLSDQPYNTTSLAFDAQPIDYDRLFDLAWRALKPSGWLILFGRGRFVADLMARDEFLYERVWVKSRKTGGQNSGFRPLLQHEWVLHFKRGPVTKGAYNPQITEGHEPITPVQRAGAGSHFKATNRASFYVNHGTRHPTTIMRYDAPVLDYANPVRQNGVTHPTAKPLGLLSELILTHSAPGDLVVDPYNGGDATRASTAEAAYLSGRTFVGAELVPETYRATQRRLEALLSQPALFSA